MRTRSANAICGQTLTATTSGVLATLFRQASTLELFASGADIYIVIGGSALVADDPAVAADGHSFKIPNGETRYVDIADGVKIAAKTATGTGQLTVNEVELA